MFPVNLMLVEYCKFLLWMMEDNMAVVTGLHVHCRLNYGIDQFENIYSVLVFVVLLQW